MNEKHEFSSQSGGTTTKVFEWWQRTERNMEKNFRRSFSHLALSALLFSAVGSEAVCGASSAGPVPVADWGGVGTSSSAFFENIDVRDETWFVIPENMIAYFTFKL